MNNDLRFSGVVVTYNDCTHLSECLSHLSFCDELVVVDLGSSDDSIQIAEHFNARIVRHEWVPMVEIVRQFAVDQASNNWIVFMDPDLIFPAQLIDRVKSLILSNDGLASITIPYRNHFLNHPIKYGRWGGIVSYPAVMHRQRVELYTQLHLGFGIKPGWQTMDINTGCEIDYIRHYWADSWDHFFKKHRRYFDTEGQSGFKSGWRFSWPKNILGTVGAVFESLVWKKGFLDGWIGVQLSFLWGWYIWHKWQAVRRYQNSLPASERSKSSHDIHTKKRSGMFIQRVWMGGRRRLSDILLSLSQKVRSRPIPGLNLLGDRDIEWTWILSHLGNNPGKALDVGAGSSLLLSLTAAQRGYEVIALDREQYNHPFISEGVILKQGDVLQENFSPSYFDLVIVCSTIEHIGLTGRYSVSQLIPDGDLATMAKLLVAIKPGGIMLLTLPVGQDAVFSPHHRVYGELRLPKLIDGWLIEDECYWVKGSDDRWKKVSRQEALSSPGSKYHYGLGCFILKKGSE
jgi:glycosyltransferase involved in cell wall biosynthesis